MTRQDSGFRFKDSLGNWQNNPQFPEGIFVAALKGTLRQMGFEQHEVEEITKKSVKSASRASTPAQGPKRHCWDHRQDWRDQHWQSQGWWGQGGQRDQGWQRSQGWRRKDWQGR